MRCTFPKVHLSKIHDWHHPLRIVPYRAIIYAPFSKRAPMTVTWSNFVNNTLIASIYQCVYIRLLRRDQGIVDVFVGPRNRHWGAFAKRCKKSRETARCDGAVPIVYCFRKMHVCGSKSHAVYSIPLCFYLG